MSAFVLRRHTHLSPPKAFAAVADFREHARGVPLTHIETDLGPPAVGWKVTAVTALGAVRLLDSMVLTRWQPPGEDGCGGYALRKTGRVLAGWAEVEVAPAGEGGTQVCWTEQIELRPRALRAVTAPVSGRLGAIVFGRALDALVDRAELEAGP